MNAIATLVLRRSKVVLVAALVIVLATAVIGFGAFGVLKTAGQTDPGAESTRAGDLIESSFGGDTNLVLLIDGGRAGAARSPAAVAEGTRVTNALQADHTIDSVHSFTVGARPLLSHDARYGLIAMHVQNDDDAGQLIDRFAGDHGGIRITAGGGLAFDHDVGPQIGQSLALAESIAVPIVLILLLVVFGSVVAALLPLVIGGIAVMGTFAELAILGRITNVSIYSVNLTTALGLGLGIDYALLTVARFRERLDAGDDVPAAVRHTVRTAGRTIAFSAATVAIALASLLIFPLYFLRSFAYAGVGVVLIAGGAAIVVTPALLAVLGHRVDAGRMPWARRSATTADPATSMWGRVARGVMRRPVLTAVPVIALLLLAASPLLGVSFGTPDDRVLRTSVGSRHVGDVLRTGFGTTPASPIAVVTTGRADGAALTAYAGRLGRLQRVEHAELTGRATTTGGTPAARFMVTPTDDAASGAAQSLVHTIRAIAPPAGDDALVGGDTAVLVDSKHAVGSRLWIAGTMIVVTTLILLFLFTGSVLQPLRALVSSGLSIAATLGVLVAIFQHGHGASLLTVTPRPMDTAMTVLMFCIVFGLSIDYEVFVTSRIKELHDSGADTAESVVGGLARTGRLLTAAALLLAISFFAFLVSSVSFLQMFGMGAGLAVLIDALVVRGVLLPAFMRLAGDAAWWVPRRLHGIRRRLAINDV